MMETAKSHSKLISVLMSTYNETEEELRKSISSILSQTYENFEFLIINDNPENNVLAEVLEQIQDNRVCVIRNTMNLGLVKSLNKGLKIAKGELIARMDADDISYPDRFEKQVEFLENYQYDMVGCFIRLIDERDNIVQDSMKYPVSHQRIKIFTPSGSCLAHPAWMVKKSVYELLNGYRAVPRCEDLDFILRAQAKGIRMGNVPKIELDYRIRRVSISNSGLMDQYLLRNFLMRKRNYILTVTEEEIFRYLNSQEFARKQLKYSAYLSAKHKYKSHKIGGLVDCILNPFFYKDVKEKLYLYGRELFAE